MSTTDEAVAGEEPWLHRSDGNVIGGGAPVLTGSGIVTAKDVPLLEKFTARGTR